MAYAIIGFTSCLAHAAFGDLLPRVRYTKQGGMRFLRVGRLQTSWCICRKPL